MIDSRVLFATSLGLKTCVGVYPVVLGPDACLISDFTLILQVVSAICRHYGVFSGLGALSEIFTCKSSF